MGQGQGSKLPTIAFGEFEGQRTSLQVSEAAAAGRLADLTVPELKCWLRARGAKVTGNKVDVVARVAERLKEEEEAGRKAKEEAEQEEEQMG